MHKELLFLNELKNQIQEKFSKTDYKSWENPDFELLSNDIQSTTKEYLSVDTLKRIFEKKKTESELYNPQKGTKDVLSKYLGFKSWIHFKECTILHDQPLMRGNNKNKLSKTFLSITVLVPIISIIFILIFLINSNKKLDYNQSLRSNLTKGESPLNVIFNYDLKNIDSDSLYLYLGYKKHFRGSARNMLKLDKSHTIVTESYLQPGFYKPTLLIDGEVRDSLNIHVQNKLWIAYVHPENLPNDDTVNAYEEKGYLYVKPDKVRKLGFKENDYYHSLFTKCTDFPDTEDNFCFKTRVKVSKAEGGILCYDVNIELTGEKSIIDIKFVEKGCTRWANLQVSEIVKSGLNNDLSFMGKDFQQWREIEILVKEKKLSILFENELLYSTRYEKSLGEIKCINFKFKGSGKVDFVTLQNKKGELVLQDEF